MGVRGLTALLQRLAPRAVTTQDISHYRGKTLAVDASCYLNRFIYGLDPHPARVQRGVYRFCLYLQLNGIKPIFVFDGPDRIIEKQREAKRRQIAKEKAEKSFGLEKMRKSRLKGLKGSSELLQTVSSEQMTSILADIQLQDKMDSIDNNIESLSLLPESEATTPATATVTPTNKTETEAYTTAAAEVQLEMMPSEALKAIPAVMSHNLPSNTEAFTKKLDPLDITISLQDDKCEIDVYWNVPPLPEDAHKLESHLRYSSDLCLEDTFMPPSGADFRESLGGIEYSQDTLDHLEVDTMIKEYMDAVYEPFGSLKDIDNPSQHPVLRTGTSFQRIISTYEPAARLEVIDPSDPSYDFKVRKVVHDALKKFVKNVEDGIDGSAELWEENATRRQKELNQLELKLVQEIKETSRINRGRRKEARPEKSSRKKLHAENNVTHENDPSQDTFATEPSSGPLEIGARKDKDDQQLDIIAQESQLDDLLDSSKEALPEHSPVLTKDIQPMDFSKEYQPDRLLDPQKETLHDGLLVNEVPRPKQLVEYNKETETEQLLGSKTMNVNDQSSLDAPPELPAGSDNGVQSEQSSEPVAENQFSLDDPLESTHETPMLDDVDHGEVACLDDVELESSAETEQDGDLQSTIRRVLTTHRSVFALLERRTLRVTWPLVQSCQDLLKAMGQPVVQADDAEAEAVCAQLTTLGWADASVSEDTDTAVFGNGLLLRNVGASTEKGIIEINPLEAHTSLNLSRDAFRDMCILCGTDFSGTIEGIGSLRAAKLMQRYGSIESIMANENNKPREDFVYDRARRVFDRTPTVPELHEAYQPKPENPRLLQQLMSKYEIDREEIIKEILTEVNQDTTDLSTDPFTASSLGADPFQAQIINIPKQDGPHPGQSSSELTDL